MKFSTREIGYICLFAKFNTREKSVFKKIRESRNLIRAKINTFKVHNVMLKECVYPNGHSFFYETEIRNLENYEMLRPDFHFSLLSNT